MWPLMVVVPDELGEYRPEMLLIEDDQVVEALSAKCADDSFNDRVRPRARYGRGDGVDADALGPCTEVAAIHGIAITQQMPRLASPGRRLDELMLLAKSPTTASARCRGHAPHLATRRAGAQAGLRQQHHHLRENPR